MSFCLQSFLEETAKVTDWYMLGVYMDVPREDLSHVEKQFSSQGAARCRAELFNVWMKRTPNASWELIAAALEKLGETVLAEKIRKICPLPQPIASQNITTSAEPSTVKVVIEKSRVELFTILEMKFTEVVIDLEKSLEEKHVSLKELKRFLDIRLDLDMELSQVASIDQLFKQIKPHFCIFNTVILKDIVEKFVGEPLKQQLENYNSKLDEFTETAEISLLKKVEFVNQYSSAYMPQVIFKLTGFWPSVTIKRFQRFVDHIFEANSSALTHIRVKQGCICVTWFARKSAIPSLAARAQEKVLFMRHVGVLSLSVGDTVILEQEETVEEETDLSSALIQAITADCTEAVEFLLFLGADPNCTSTNGTTPLIIACENNSISITELLLKAEADVNAQDKWDATAIKVVCSSKTPNNDLVELLVQSGAQFVIPDEIQTTLGIAAMEGHTDIVQYLVSEGAPVNAQDRDGVTALMLACCYNRSEIIVYFLLNHGADPNIQDRYNGTALQFACYKQMTVGVELLLAYGADHSLRGRKGSTPLMFSCLKKDVFTMDPSILVMLLSAGADPNAQNEEDSTALLFAVELNYRGGVTVLLNAGANVNIQDIFRSTALHKAAENGFLAISELLLASGAQASLTDNAGMTPLDYALDNNHHDVCQLLLVNTDSDPLPAVTESIDPEHKPLPTKNLDSSSLVTETIEQDLTPLHRQTRSQHSSAFSTLDQLRYALEYPLSPADTIKHHQADEEGETSKPDAKND